VISPFVSFDYMNAPVNHNFPGGSFLGATANYDGTIGVKVGPQFKILWLYGIGGISVLNETLNVNFGPVASSSKATVPGGTLGAGAAWQPASNISTPGGGTRISTRRPLRRRSTTRSSGRTT
jgi:hypothetical protein